MVHLVIEVLLALGLCGALWGWWASSRRRDASAVATIHNDEPPRVRDQPAVERHEPPASSLDEGLVKLSVNDPTERHKLVAHLERSREELLALVDVQTTDLALKEKALRESEARYRSLVSLSPVAILVVDEEVLFVNQAGVEMFAALSPDDLIGQSIQSLMFDGHMTTSIISLEHALEDDGAMHEVVVVLKRLDGIPFYAELSSAPMILDQQRASLILIRDVTERRRLDQLKEEFISTVNHELRTPLTSIKGSLGLALGGVLGDLSTDLNEALVIAHRNCDRLIRLINDMLDLQKIASGRMTYRLEALPLDELLDRAIKENAPFATEHKVSLTRQGDEGVLSVQADPDRFIQIVTNLLSNAIKFSPEGESVDVIAKRAEDMAQISVVDHGPGIPLEFQERLFQKFSQADASTTKRRGGTGLGLNISQAIVEAHGGQIGFETEEGEGSTFTFTIPLAP